MNEELEKPALLVPSADEVTQMQNAQAAASEVTNAVLTQRLELDEKKRTVTMLQKALVSHTCVFRCTGFKALASYN